MDLPPFLRFDPVPGQARHDAWTAELQIAFVIQLARGMSPAAAARAVGKSRQAAYALRKRPGGEGFAAAWDRALRFAAQMRRGGGRAPLSRAAPPRAAPAPQRSPRNTAAEAVLRRLYPGVMAHRGRRPDGDNYDKNDEKDGA
jgi:hypothetical protein